MGKVAILHPNTASPTATLADCANREGLDGVIVMARVDGCWSTAWSTGVSIASLCLASMKLQHDVMMHAHDARDTSTLPDDAA